MPARPPTPMSPPEVTPGAGARPPATAAAPSGELPAVVVWAVDYLARPAVVARRTAGRPEARPPSIFHSRPLPHDPRPA